MLIVKPMLKLRSCHVIDLPKHKIEKESMKKKDCVCVGARHTFRELAIESENE